MDRDRFLETCRDVFNSITRTLATNRSLEVINSSLTRLDALTRNVNRMTTAYPDFTPLLDSLRASMDMIEEMKRNAEEQSVARPDVQSGGVGRPKYLVSRDQLQTLLEMNFSNKDISSMIGISVSSVKRRLQEFNLSRRHLFSDISDDDLDSRIRHITQGNPTLGQRNVLGQLVAGGIRVQRDRVAEALLRVDSAAVAMRWAQTILRRTYSVPGPNALWHIDGNHKLVRWGFVIHGGIDGYSRLVVFVKAATNNRASTVLSGFVEATNQYGVPSRVRCDHGGENIEVALFMNTFRGENRGSCITGRSVHNQRIERFWRDLYQSCTMFYRELFQHLEREGVLNLDDQVQMWALRYVFLPRINRDLTKFQQGWNNHRLRTEHGRTPQQLYVQGIVENRGNGQTGVDSLFFEPDVAQDALPEDFGVDWNGPVPAADHHVSVEAANCPLTDEQVERVRTQVNPLTESVDGIDVYIRALGLCFDE